MRKLSQSLALVACCLLVCLMAVGCGSKAQFKEPFVGSWEISEMTVDGEETTSDEFSAFKKFGLNVYVDLYEDGTCQLDNMGDVQKGTWEATAQNKATMTIDERAQEMTIEDDALVFVDGEDVMRFSKIEVSEEAGEEAEADGEDAEGEDAEGEDAKGEDDADEAADDAAEAEDADQSEKAE